ncbi:MAG: TolC family protein [Bacteroidia bacterium]|nr:TolC family protein [Bacteroidia bacterium]
MSRRLLILAFLLTSALSIQAQSIWSLEKCISHALDNSIDVKLAKLGLENAQLVHKQSKLERLPSLNINTGYGWNFGRQIDPATNDFFDQRFNFTSGSASSFVTLFAGRGISNTIKRNNVDEDIANLDSKATIENLKISIVGFYVSILLAEEQVENSKTRVKSIQDQLENTDKLIKAGSLPVNDRLQVLADLANEEQNLISAQNNVDINYNLLKQVLFLDPDVEIRIAKPSTVIPIETAPDKISFSSLYKSAINTLPEIRANELRLRSAELDVDIAKGNLYPTLSLSGSINSNYSSLGKTFENTNQTIRIPQNVFIDGNPALLETETFSFIVKDNPFWDQFNENIGRGFNLNLNIPIFNARRSKVNVERLQMQIENVKLQNEQALNTVKSNVQQALSDARAAQKQLDASQKSLAAQSANYENVEKRYQLGAVSTFEYITARNNLDAAKVNETISKFDYIFKVKILDFYMGKRLTIN